jgi:hypothetical protein
MRSWIALGAAILLFASCAYSPSPPLSPEPREIVVDGWQPPFRPDRSTAVAIPLEPGRFGRVRLRYYETSAVIERACYVDLDLYRERGLHSAPAPEVVFQTVEPTVSTWGARSCLVQIMLPADSSQRAPCSCAGFVRSDSGTWVERDACPALCDEAWLSGTE